MALSKKVIHGQGQKGDQFFINNLKRIDAMNTITQAEPTNILTFAAAIKAAPEHNSIWGMAIKSFKQDIERKSAKDIIRLVQQLKSQIADNETAMEEILGTKFLNYIKNFKV